MSRGVCSLNVAPTYVDQASDRLRLRMIGIDMITSTSSTTTNTISDNVSKMAIHRLTYDQSSDAAFTANPTPNMNYLMIRTRRDRRACQLSRLANAIAPAEV
jgi:hypothetical protein